MRVCVLIIVHMGLETNFANYKATLCRTKFSSESVGCTIKTGGQICALSTAAFIFMEWLSRCPIAYFWLICSLMCFFPSKCQKQIPFTNLFDHIY